MDPLELVFGPLAEFARYYRPVFPKSDFEVVVLIILAGLCFGVLLWLFNV